jgi:hypothetical protein
MFENTNGMQMLGFSLFAAIPEVDAAAIVPDWVVK